MHAWELLACSEAVKIEPPFQLSDDDTLIEALCCTCGACVLVATGFCASFICASFGLGALGFLSLLFMLTLHSICYPRPCRL
jgi:hypothetical protein